MAVVESYPQLEAMGNVGQPQEEMTSTENEIPSRASSTTTRRPSTRPPNSSFEHLVGGWPARSRPTPGDLGRRRSRGAQGQPRSRRAAATRARSFEQQGNQPVAFAPLIFWFVWLFGWLGFGGDFVFREATRGGRFAAYQYFFPWMTPPTLLAGPPLRSMPGSGERQVLWAIGALPVTEPARLRRETAPRVVLEMAIAAGVRGRAATSRRDDPNAFATGRDDATPASSSRRACCGSARATSCRRWFRTRRTREARRAAYDAAGGAGGGGGSHVERRLARHVASAQQQQRQGRGEDGVGAPLGSGSPSGS